MKYKLEEKNGTVIKTPIDKKPTGYTCFIDNRVNQIYVEV